MMKMAFARTALSAALLIGTAGASAWAADDVPCAQIARKVSDAVAAKPERVLIIVEDAVLAHERCACEIVKSAIIAAQAQPPLVGQIVYAAITVVPQVAASVNECALAASPDAAGEIRKAVKKALGTELEASEGQKTAAAEDAAPSFNGKNPPSVKNPPEPPQPPAREEADFGLSPVAIGGVYLVYPGGSSIRTEKTRIIEKVAVKKKKRVVIVVCPPSATASEETAP